MTTTTGPTQADLPAATYQPMRGGAAALAAVLEEVPHVPVFAAIVNDDGGVVIDVLDYADGVRAAAALGLVRSRASHDGPDITEWRNTHLVAGARTDVIVRAYDVPRPARPRLATLIRLLVALTLLVPAALANVRLIAQTGSLWILLALAVGVIVAPSNAAMLGVLNSFRRALPRRLGGAR